MATEGGGSQVDGRWKSSAVRGLLVIATILLMKEAAPLLLPVATAVVLTFVFAPVVRGLKRGGVPEPAGAAVVVITLLGVTLLVTSTLVGPASQWWERAPQTVAQVMAQFDRLRASILSSPAPPPRPPAGRNAERAAPAQAQQANDPLKDKLATEGVAITRVVIGKVFSFGLSAAATVILLYFLLASEHWMLSR